MRSRKIAAALILSICGLGFGSEAMAAPVDHMLSALSQPTFTETLEGLDPAQWRDALCLALNLYHEARGSTKADLMAVAWVTRNRVDSTAARGRSYCQIIWEKGQYSWTTRSVSSLTPREQGAWRRVLEVATAVMGAEDRESDPTNGANTFYLRKLGVPSWTRRGTGRMQIGAHTYVKLPGR